MLYSGEDEFTARCAAFVRDGLERDEAVLVVVNAAKISRLRDALGADADGVEFADMGKVGTNPARIIPLWRRFSAKHAGRGRARGIGEPVSPRRRPDELVECQRHEQLIDVAFDGGPPWWLVCPYDTDSLDPAVIADAERTHRPSNEAPDPFAGTLEEPATATEPVEFDAGSLRAIRHTTADLAAACGFDSVRADELVTAVNEIASNSVRHGGGRGRFRCWREPGAVACEVTDGGRIVDPLAGRIEPPPMQAGGHGLWLANQLCDLVQVRSSAAGTVVRLKMRLA